MGIVEEERNNEVDRRQEEWEGQWGVDTGKGRLIASCLGLRGGDSDTRSDERAGVGGVCLSPL